MLPELVLVFASLVNEVFSELVSHLALSQVVVHIVVHLKHHGLKYLTKMQTDCNFISYIQMYQNTIVIYMYGNYTTMHIT